VTCNLSKISLPTDTSTHGIPERTRTGRIAAAALTLLLSHVVPASADDASVTMAKLAFTPATLTIKAGSTVTFENLDEMPHNIIGAGGAFRSKLLNTNDKFSMVFTTPGEFAYICGVHPNMKGKVVVTP
jgi:plastocyanin